MNETAHFGLLNFEIVGTVTLALYCTVLFFIERRSSLSNPLRQLLPVLLFVVSIVTMAAVVGSAYFGWEVGGSRIHRLPLLAMWALNNALFLVALACIAIVLSKIVLESLYVVFPQAVRVVSFIVRYGFAAMSGTFLLVCLAFYVLAPALAPTDDEAANLVKVGFIIFGLMCLAFVAAHLSFARYLVYLIRQAILARPGPADPAAVKMQRRTFVVSLFSFFGGAFGGIMWCLHGTSIPLYYYWVHTHLIHATLQLLVQLWFLRMDPYSVWLAAMRGKAFGPLGGASSTSNMAMTSVTPGSDKA